MSSRRKKAKKQPEIPTELRVNLTPELRAAMEVEEFEPTTAINPAASDVQLPAVKTISECSTQKSLRSKQKPEMNTLIRYENEPQSVYDHTAGTNSFESIIEGCPPGAEDVTEEQNKDYKYKLRKVPLHRMKPLKSEVLTEQRFLEGMQKDADGNYMPGVTEEVIYKRGEPEMAFIQALIDDVNNLVALSGRTDVSIQYGIEFEENGLPRLMMRLGPKRQPVGGEEDEELWRQAQLEKEEVELLNKKKPQKKLHSLGWLFQLANFGLQLAKFLP